MLLGLCGLAAWSVCGGLALGQPATEPAVAAAPPPAAPKLDTGDNAWVLTSSALVLMMTGPGLALFYCGLVRKKNVLATLMQSFAITCLVTVLYAVSPTACRSLRAAASSAGSVARSCKGFSAT